MQGDIVAQGVELMLFGMGTVIVFLALLVVATTTMSRTVARFFPEPEPPAPSRSPATTLRSAPAPVLEDQRLAAAITIAVHRHRKRSRQG